MILKIEISKSRFNQLHRFIGERFIYPKNKKVLNDIRKFVAIELSKLGLECYDGFRHVEFYEWMGDKIAKKFKLKSHSTF